MKPIAHRKRTGNERKSWEALVNQIRYFRNTKPDSGKGWRPMITKTCSNRKNNSGQNKKLIREINELKEELEIKNEKIQELEYELSLKDEKIEDIRNDLELKTVEIDEYSQKITEKDEKITNLNNALMKYKFEKEKVDLKLKNEINYEKSRMKEMDDLEKKIHEKIVIIDDKQDQINYLRTLINDYKEQVGNNSNNLELQLKKITRTYDNLLSQKDSIIEKQDKTIEEMIESSKQIAKDNKATITSLELQIGNYRELLKKYEK